MSRAMRVIAVLSISVLALLSASPTFASEPVRADGAVPQGSVEPTGVPVCDIKLSLVDGPLVDENFSVRDWEPFIVWGFGYPPDTSIVLEFIGPVSGTFSFDTSTDSAGEFADDFTFSPTDSSTTETFSLTAEPVGGGCIDGITLTVHPAYPFTDVDGFENEIAWLYREGITGGCTPTRFCPNNSVTRGQMAAFLNRALGLPSTDTDFFDDDDGTIFENDINALAASGITGGCATRRYCPNSLVTRQQMASFLTRAFLLPASSTDFFTDDNSSIHENDINALAASGITGGCAAGRYCPTANVTREQMAAFLYRGFN